MDWTEAIELVPLGEGGSAMVGGGPTAGGQPVLFGARVNEDWTSLQGVHGGVVAALGVKAADTVLAALGVEAGTTLRSATFGYVSGNRVGDLEIAVDVVRRGRSLVSTHVTVTQEGKVTTVGRLHHSTPWEGLEFSAAPAPPQRPPHTVRMGIEGMPSHLDNVEAQLDPTTTLFAGNPRAEWLAWSRPLRGGELDAVWLTMYGDYFPPAVFTHATEPRRAVTIEYSLQIHDAAGRWRLGDGEYLATRVHAFHSHDGFAVEDGWIWLPDGELLATMRQTRLAG